MFKFLGTVGHLKAEEFVDLLEGLKPEPRRLEHLENCPECGSTLESMRPLFRDVAGIDGTENANLDADLAGADWSRLRSSVRDRLLGRAVKRGWHVERWASVTALSLVWLMAAAGWWHYQTAHVAGTGSQSGAAAPESFVSAPLSSEAPEVSPFDDAEILEAEALAWSELEIFTALNDLEASEEETLRELIAMAMENGSDFGSGEIDQ